MSGVSERKSVKLSRPVTIGEVRASEILVSTEAEFGWLLDAPATPDWFVGVVKGLMAALPDDPAAASKLEAKDLLKELPWPTGSEVSAVFPWMAHMVGAATGQPKEVVRQMGVADVFKIFVELIPSLMSAASFLPTSVPGAGTSPGSSAGPLTQSAS